MKHEFPSRSLASTSDLVVHARWKPGIIHAEDLITYQSRLALTFRAVFDIRRTSREGGQIPMLSDPIERLEQIHSFRFRANDEGFLLAVTYDHHWEPYARALWGPAGPFLDLLLCNCEDYVLARDSELRPWAQWIRDHEVPSDYFYSATALTVADLSALSQIERLQREDANPIAADRDLAGRPSLSAQASIAQARQKTPALAHEQALRILAVMYRLTRFHGSDIVTIGDTNPLQPDALTLWRATRCLLEEWNSREASPGQRMLFAKQLAWFEQQEPYDRTKSTVPAMLDKSKVQRGLLTSFDAPGSPITHGAMLLIRIENQTDALASLGQIKLSSELPDAPDGGIFRTLAFTKTGLTRIGVPESSIEALGDAFGQGAKARAGQLGDVRGFHPEKWKLPRRNWPSGDKGAVPLETIDLIVILRTNSTKAAGLEPDDRNHPLNAAIINIGRLPGFDLMHVEALGRADPDHPGVDHLGFFDGLSQPVPQNPPFPDTIDSVPPETLVLLNTPAPLRPFEHGSFLAIRRIEIDRKRFDTIAERAAVETGLPVRLVRAKLMGREDDGTPLVPHTGKNEFDFAEDPKGERCPLQSHVRRSNPRTPKDPAPRIVRRGMSFGPRAGSQPNAPRGAMFMASCADLAEQYEILLRWINGGNSSRLGSWAADPIVGPALAGDRRLFAFPHAGRVCRVPMDDAGLPVSQVTWSIYAIVPPTDFLEQIQKLPKDPQIDLADEGRKIVEQIKALPKRDRPKAWMAALRDPLAERSNQVDYLWAYVRSLDGKVLRATKDWVLVGGLDDVLKVLRDDGKIYSVEGAGKRLTETIGNIHLGFDEYTDAYKAEAPTINGALKDIKEKDSFEIFRNTTARYLSKLLGSGLRQIDIIAMLLEPTTYSVFPHWFGIPHQSTKENPIKEFILPGSQDWRSLAQRTEKRPTFPGDYWNIARYAFIPIPSDETARVAMSEGPILKQAALDWITDVGRDKLPGTVSNAISSARKEATDEYVYEKPEDVARVLTGTVLGAIATTLGTSARVIYAMATSGELQRLASDWQALVELGKQPGYQDAVDMFGPLMHKLMQSRPVPELMWRTVKGKGHKLGEVYMEAGDVLFLGTDSASFEESRRPPEPGKKPEAYVTFGMAASKPDTKHGCPARNMALGMLLGWLAGIADVATINPGSPTLVLDLAPRPKG